MSRLNIRVKYHPNGTATVSGIPSTYLQCIFTAASLHHYDSEKQHKAREAEVRAEAAANERLGDLILENYAEDGAWMRIMRVLIDSVATPRRYSHGYEDVPVAQLDQLGRFCRFRAVREARASRIRVDELMEQIFGRAGREVAG